MESGAYSRCYASGTSDPAASVTVSYTCQFTHNLYVGTSLYSDRATVGVQLDGDTQTALNCWLNTSSAVVTRRLLRTAVTPGRHTVTIQMQTAGAFYFDFLEAAVLSDVPDALAPRTNISAGARFRYGPDLHAHSGATPVDHGQARLRRADERIPRACSGGTSARCRAARFQRPKWLSRGTFAGGDTVTLTLNGTALGKTCLPGGHAGDDRAGISPPISMARSSGAWASASGGTLTIVSGSPAPATTWQSR